MRMAPVLLILFIYHSHTGVLRIPSKMIPRMEISLYTVICFVRCKCNDKNHISKNGRLFFLEI